MKNFFKYLFYRDIVLFCNDLNRLSVNYQSKVETLHDFNCAKIVFENYLCVFHKTSSYLFEKKCNEKKKTFVNEKHILFKTHHYRSWWRIKWGKKLERFLARHASLSTSLIGFRQTYANNMTGYVLRFIVGQRSSCCNENQDRGSRSWWLIEVEFETRKSLPYPPPPQPSDWTIYETSDRS